MELQQIFETTKEQRVEFTHQLIERLNAGELDPLKTHLQVKALEDMLETLKAKQGLQRCSIKRSRTEWQGL
jgi:hypothetical protein